MTVKKQLDGRWLADVQPIRGQRFRKLFKTKAEALRYEQYITANKAADPAWNPKAQDRRRLSELVGLWFDLHGHMLKDSERRKAKLEALSGLRNGAVTYSKTKSSKVRTVPIQPELKAFIRDHWKRHGQFTGDITSFRRALSRSGSCCQNGRPATRSATPSLATSCRRAGTSSR